jgi:hypothetical protein
MTYVELEGKSRSTATQGEKRPITNYLHPPGGSGKDTTVFVIIHAGESPFYVPPLHEAIIR